MYYVIGQNVYAPHEGHDFDERATDTIEDDVWDLYCQDRHNFKIEDGKFIPLKPFEELQAIALNKKYIPDENKSAATLLRAMLSNAVSVRSTFPVLDDDTKIAVSGLYEQWVLGKYEVGDIRNNAGQTWECHTAHDNAVYPDITPDNPQTWANFWRPLHGKNVATARPWVKPQYGTTDMYHASEYMVYTDGKTYKCVSDTVYSPEEYSQAWEIVE